MRKHLSCVVRLIADSLDRGRGMVDLLNNSLDEALAVFFQLKISYAVSICSKCLESCLAIALILPGWHLCAAPGLLLASSGPCSAQGFCA